MVWINFFKKIKGNEKYADLISNHRWPIIRRKDIDFTTLDTYTYIGKFRKNLRNTITKLLCFALLCVALANANEITDLTEDCGKISF